MIPNTLREQIVNSTEQKNYKHFIRDCGIRQLINIEINITIMFTDRILWLNSFISNEGQQP